MENTNCTRSSNFNWADLSDDDDETSSRENREEEEEEEEEENDSKEWETVQSRKKRRAKKYMTNDDAQLLESTLNIRNLAKCLTSDQAKTIQKAGFKFEKVVPHSMFENVNSLPRDCYRFLVIKNKWSDIALFDK